MREIKCLIVMPGQTPAVTTLEASIAAFNKAVSVGSEYELLAVSKRIGKRTYILHAYDSVLEDLEPNRKVGDEIICGVFYIVAVDDAGKPVSMTERQMMKYMMRFYEPEKYSYHDALENWSDCLMKEIDSMAVRQKSLEPTRAAQKADKKNRPNPTTSHYIQLPEKYEKSLGTITFQGFTSLRGRDLNHMTSGL